MGKERREEMVSFHSALNPFRHDAHSLLASHSLGLHDLNRQLAFVKALVLPRWPESRFDLLTLA